MSRCQQCNRAIPEKGMFCPYCGFRNAAQSSPKPNNNRVKIALILAVTAVVVAGIVCGGIILAHQLSRKKTFDLTTAQYTAQVNRELGENLLHESKWVVNGAHAVYDGDGFTIDLDTDLDTQLIQKISITPPDHPTAQRIMTVTVTIVHTEVTVINNYYVFEPEPKPEKTTAPTSVPATTMPSTAYTAEDLLELSLDEIIGLMGGDFTCSWDKDSNGFVRSGFGSSGVVWIYNEEKLPGFAFHPDISIQPNADLNELKVNLKKGGYRYNGISMKGSAKYNNALSADRHYNDLTQQFGTFDIHTAAQENYLYATELGGNKITFFFRPGDDLRARLKDNKVLSTDMQQLNPQLESIEVRIEGGAAPAATPSTTGTAARQPDDNRYHSDLGWSIEIPDAWYTYGTVVEAEQDSENAKGAVGFYYQEARESKYGGHVFTIFAMPNNSPQDDGKTGGTPSGGFLGRNSQYAFYWGKATDVQYDYKNDRERHAAEYRSLSDMRQTILDSFRLD